MLYVTNNTDIAQTWCGQEIAAHDDYQVESYEQPKWANNEIFIEAIASGDAVLSDGYSNLPIGKAINILKQIDLYLRDDEGTPYFKQMVSETDLKFRSKTFTFTTGKHKSLVNKSSDGVDLGEGLLLFFDSALTELVQGESESDPDFQTRLDSNCKFTWLYFTSLVRFGIRKGRFAYRGSYTGQFNNWLEFAPHIPKSSGGSVPCLDGAFPLDVMNEGDFYEMDGCAVLMREIDEVYYSHRIGHKIEHEIGNKIKIASVFEVFV